MGASPLRRRFSARNSRSPASKPICAIDAEGCRGTHRNLRDPVADDFRPAIPHRRCQRLARPTRIFHGTPDDYNPVADCKAYLARLQEAKRDAVLTEYPDSEHGFDAGLLGVSAVTVSTNAQSARNCRLKEGEGGVLMNADTKAPFTYKDACIALNPHVGGNPATAVEARKAVSDFLQALLRL